MLVYIAGVKKIILSDQYHLSLPATFPKCVWLGHSGIQQEMANNIGKTKLYPCIHSLMYVGLYNLQTVNTFNNVADMFRIPLESNKT